MKDTGTPIKTDTSNIPSGYVGGSGSEIDPDLVGFELKEDVEVVNAAQLNYAMKSDIVKNIKITENITLSENLTITKNVEITAGKELTLANGKNLCVDQRYQTGSEGDSNYVPGYYGQLHILGTLNITNGSTFYNYTSTIVNGGEIKCFGNYVDKMLIDVYKICSLQLEDSTLYNEGTFTCNGNIETFHSNIEHAKGLFQNNGDLIVTGGKIESNAEFHNAGSLEIRDIYSETDQTCDISFGDSLTGDSNKIDYTACVYNEDGLQRAVQKQNEKVSDYGDKEAIKGYEIYNAITACEDMEISKDVTINRADFCINYVKRKDDDSEPIITRVTNNATIKLQNANLLVKGTLDNNGTVEFEKPVLESDAYGNIQVWPIGYFCNEMTGSVNQGIIYRMDDFKPDASGIVVTSSGLIDYTSNLKIVDVAIVYDFAGLVKAAVTDKDVENNLKYERIDIRKHEEPNESDIEIQKNLEIDADMFIESGSSIIVPDNVTLSFVGENHLITNQADMLVKGELRLGDGYTLVNQGTILIGETNDTSNTAVFLNNGKIQNMNFIQVLERGKLTNNGTIENQSIITAKDGEFDGTGTVKAGLGSQNEGVPEDRITY